MPKTKRYSFVSSQKLFLVILPIAILLAGFVMWTTSKDVHKAYTTACATSDFSGNFEAGQPIAIFNGQKIAAPTDVPSFLGQEEDKSRVLGVVSGDERWIEVDLSEQKLIAHEGDSIFLETRISSGLPQTPTPTGEFRVWAKLRATKMEGGEGHSYYYLPNVPYVMFFHNDQVPGARGFSLHGTYWHNDFGNRRSHGCVNLPTPVAEKLYYWTMPTLPDNKNTVYASADSPGTRIVIHD